MRHARWRPLLAGCCLMSLIVVSGCDKKAREFASRTKDILDQRSAQLSKKIAAETAAYNNFAAHAAEAHRALVDSSLRNERNERASNLAADYHEGRKPLSRWRTDLAEYARIDYATTRELLLADMDSSSRFLHQFQTLKLEQDKIDALSKLLAALAEPRSLQDEIAAAATFIQETKEEFDKKVCDELKKQKDAGGPDAKSAGALFDARCKTSTGG